MHFTDLMLKFASEEEATQNLYDKVATAWDNDDPESPIETEWEYRSRFRNIDTLGVIYKGGSWDEGGNEVETPVAVDGWHVNVRCLCSEGESCEHLEAFVVAPEPSTPRRVWA